MKIEVKTAADGETEITLSEVYSGVGIQTDAGLFGIAQRDGGIEVLLDGQTVWARGASDGLPATLPPPPEMTDKEATRIAQAIDAVSRKVGPLVRDEQEHLAVAIALTTMAAHHVLHDGGSEEDFLSVCRMSWEKSIEAHTKGCGGKGN